MEEHEITQEGKPVRLGEVICRRSDKKNLGTLHINRCFYSDSSQVFYLTYSEIHSIHKGMGWNAKVIPRSMAIPYEPVP